MEKKIKFSGRSAEVLYLAELLESVPMVNRFGSYIRELYAMIPSEYEIDIILEYDMLCALKEVFKAIGKEIPDAFPSYTSIEICTYRASQDILSAKHLLKTDIEYDKSSLKQLTQNLIFSIENIAAIYKIPEKSFLKILRDWLINHSEFIYHRKEINV
jgi:hypothetical protein